MREKLSPATKESEDEEKLKAARDHAKKQGMTNVFEDIAVVTPSTSTEERESAKKVGEFSKDHSVSVLVHSVVIQPMSIS